MEDTWIAVIAGAITTFASSFTTWFFTKRKYNTEVDANLITNMQESLEFYKTLADDNKARLEIVLAENADFRAKVAEVPVLQRQVELLQEQVTKLTSILAEYGLLNLVKEK